MRMSKVLSIAFLLVLGNTGNIFAGDITVVTENLPPFTYKEDGMVRGVATEIVQAVLREAGVDAGIRIYPWARAYNMAITQPKTLIFTIIRTPERESLFRWVDAIVPIKVFFYKLKSRTDIRINGLQDAAPHTVGLVRGGFEKEYFVKQNFHKTEEVAQHAQNIRKLQAGRICLYGQITGAES